MLLVIDVGNTHTVGGIFPLDAEPSADPLVRRRWQTHAAATADELETLLAGMLALDQRTIDTVTMIAVSSVVPRLTESWRELGRKRLGSDRTLIVGPGLRTGMRISTSEPHEVGADRIINAVAAWERWQAPCIVVDLGTATTFDVVGPGPCYLGGAIAPGLAVSVGALVQHAARLSSVDLFIPERVIGRDTASSMRSGTMLGAIAQLEGLLMRIRRELVELHDVDERVHVPAIATGGFARMLHDSTDAIDAYDDDLTLRGLHLLALHR